MRSAILILSFLLSLPAWGQDVVVDLDGPRTWTDAKGKTIKASLSKIEITVELKLAGGKTVRVPLERLSAGDQKSVLARITETDRGPAVAARPAQPAVRQVRPWTRDRSSDELRQDAVGMTKESVVLWLGPPKATTDTGDEKELLYEDIAVDPDSHKSVHAVIVIEKGRVTRVMTH